ncbi:transposase-like protein, partial [Variovorax sp. GrIS 2.14]|uniref:transposase n=1 Tax=Variovorax sp. GrIS 2.14 TaxID=3071709 RepID=UPI0038F632EB
MTKTTRARYTLEFKQEAVRLVDGGQSIAAAARTLGLVEQTLFNWVKAKREGKLSGADSKAVSAEQMEISRLRAELARVKMERDILDLQLEHDLLKKASKIIKKGLGVSLQLLTNREKTLLVAALKQTHALSDLLPELGLARSSYFYHRARLQIADKYAGARQAIADIFQLNHRCYGYRRIQAMLSRQCVRLSEKVVQRLMKQECLVVAKP